MAREPSVKSLAPESRHHTRNISFSNSWTNGYAKRLGGVILKKARCIRIGANLPESPRPEILKTAGHLYSSTPRGRLCRKIPFGYVTGNEPDLSHLRVNSCRAYVLKRNIIRSEKPAERAHPEHFVGYNSTSAYRIWTPSQNRATRTRDVLFNEEEFDKLKDLNLTQLGRADNPHLINTIFLPFQQFSFTFTPDQRRSK